MKLKSGWVLSEMGGEYIVVPTGESAESFRGIVRLNETAKDIWQGLMDGMDENGLTDKIMELYEGADRDKVQKAVRSVIEKLEKEGLLTE